MSQLVVMQWRSIVLDASVKALVLFLAAGAAVLLLRRASAASRHLVWLFTLASLIALPGLSATLPGWHVHLWSGARLLPGVIRPSAASGPPIQATTVSRSIGIRRVHRPLIGREMPDRHPRPIAALSPWTPIRTSSATLPSPVSLTWAFLVWLAVAAATLARSLAGLVQLWRIREKCRSVTAATVTVSVAQLARELGLKRPVTLLHGMLDGPPAMPMTWGFLRPTVLLPTGFAGWPEERRRAVLLHELAHVKRSDWLAQMLAQVACSLYWFHPLVWWAARRLRVESEQACDDHVLTAGVKATDYAAHLLYVVRTLKIARSFGGATVSMAQQSLIEERVRAILNAGLHRGVIPRSAPPMALVAVGALLLPLAAVRVAASTPRISSSNLKSPTSVHSRARVESSLLRERSDFAIEPHAASADMPDTRPTSALALDAQAPHTETNPRLELRSLPWGEQLSVSLHSESARRSGRKSDPALGRQALDGDERIVPRAVLSMAVETGSATPPEGEEQPTVELISARSDAETAEAGSTDAKTDRAEAGSDDLAGKDLSGKDFSGKDLSGKNLSGSNLTGAKLTGANLTKADLSGANLTNTDFSRARMAGADISGATMNGTRLSGADLSGADLSGVSFVHVDANGANLTHADLSGSNLKDVNLAGRDLSGADLSGANLSGAKLADANLTKADLSGANLENADLSHARLADADLSGANLNGTRLDGADLKGADVSGTKLDKTKQE